MYPRRAVRRASRQECQKSKVIRVNVQRVYIIIKLSEPASSHSASALAKLSAVLEMPGNDEDAPKTKTRVAICELMNLIQSPSPSPRDFHECNLQNSLRIVDEREFASVL